MRAWIMTLLAVVMLAVCSLFGAPAPVSAFTIANGATNVGGLDKFLTSAIVKSGDQSELDWVNGYLITQGLITTKYTTMIKYNNEGELSSTNTVVPGVWNWRLVDNSTSVVAQDLQGAPEYFFIKTGNITPDDKTDSPPDHFLFKNDANLNWAVVDLSDFGNVYELSGVGVLSHVGELGGGSTSVPEPGTMILLGIGVLGLAIFGKRRRNNRT